ncbi:MAG: GNAT family N-acetyltransferase [Actinobacteria bacterium]|nr:MAG: GNAT family N-acetyltransferase [Actinomycetota bacterium]
MEVRLATLDDVDDIGRMLHDFNSEYEDVTPGPAVIAQRLRPLMESGDSAALLVGDGPDGFALLRFRPSLWVEGLECYLAELYVVPHLRGERRGRALMDAVLAFARERGAGYIELNTGEDDVAARALYESLGFSNREGKADGSIQLYYELEL